jgi:hypothetical protein
MSAPVLDHDHVAVQRPMETRISSDEVSALSLESPPWLPLGDESSIEWENFQEFGDDLAARIVAGRVEYEGVPTFIETRPHWSGFRVIVRVPRPLLHRARWLMSLPFPTESELGFLATGELLDPEVR